MDECMITLNYIHVPFRKIVGIYHYVKLHVYPNVGRESNNREEESWILLGQESEHRRVRRSLAEKEISTGDEAALREKEIESQVPHIGNFRMMSGNNDLTLLLFEKKKKLLDSISSGQVIPVSISGLCRDGLKLPKLRSWQRKQQSGGRILDFVRAGKRASQGKKKFGRKGISTGDEAALREKEIESQVPHIGNFRMMSGNNDLTLLLFEKKKKLLDSISSGQGRKASIAGKKKFGRKEISTGDEAALREKEIESHVPHVGNFRMMSGNNDLTLLLFEKKKKLLDSISSGQVIPVSISGICRGGLKFPKLQSH
ncbi:hypothetical protein CEXT_583411 [Caerostris extrusa]|uniref:Ribosomal protein S3 n=1 Tax=Caerostris extrusa TaxID=172846 RepID=A0AAV4WH98_CAEEX|nr:hypothetical protein CEXT_583411 [Caerostris extrusa]